MIEPTETETKERLDAFADAMQEIAREADENPDALSSAPHHRPVRRLDEVKATKRPVVKYGYDEHPDLAGDPEPAAVGAPPRRPPARERAASLDAHRARGAARGAGGEAHRRGTRSRRSSSSPRR